MGSPLKGSCLVGRLQQPDSNEDPNRSADHLHEAHRKPQTHRRWVIRYTLQTHTRVTWLTLVSHEKQRVFGFPSNDSHTAPQLQQPLRTQREKTWAQTITTTLLHICVCRNTPWHIGCKLDSTYQSPNAQAPAEPATSSQTCTALRDPYGTSRTGLTHLQHTLQTNAEI